MYDVCSILISNHSFQSSSLILMIIDPMNILLTHDIGCSPEYYQQTQIQQEGMTLC